LTGVVFIAKERCSEMKRWWTSCRNCAKRAQRNCTG